MSNSNKPTESILGIVVGFLILFFLFQKDWLLYVALAAGLAGLFSPFLSRWIDWGWMQFVKALGWVNSRILLSLVFFVVLLPISLLFRLFTGKDTMMLKKRTDTYFKERNHTFTAKDLEHPW